MLNKRTKLNDFWEQNLVCPACKGALRTVDFSLQCQACHRSYPIIDCVPCFVPISLDEHQKSELESAQSRITYLRGGDRKTGNFVVPQWLEGRLDQKTTDIETRIIIIGGGSRDDLPYIATNFKFNIDHLAHEYIKFACGMARAQATEGAVKHIASTSESLPFKDKYADIVFSKNSLDHVSNPLKTMLEIHRVLKPEGRFFLSVYYNSNFVDCCETTIIDEDFVNNHLKNIFNVEWIALCPVEKKSGHEAPRFSLPERRKLEWLYAVCKKRENYKSYAPKTFAEYGKLTSNFYAALYYDENLKYKEASKFYLEVLSRKPFLESDEMRILYSKIRYLAITDHEAFKKFFEEFQLSNRDPFWWKIVILSSKSFMKKKLKNEIGLRFSGDERDFLEKCLKSTTGLGIKRFVKSRKTLYKLSKPFYKLLKKFIKNKDFFKRNPF